MVTFQCVVLTWQFSQKRNVELESLALFEKSYVTENENGIVKIYWAFNGMKQEDPILTEFIKNDLIVESINSSFISVIIVPPVYHLLLNIEVV